jgi:phosphatidylinositol-3,4,5-trisphosphate 3-phosphatase/dual-specificity protein phosphatase PTEN
LRVGAGATRQRKLTRRRLQVAKLKPNKADERVLLITNAAIYNIKPSIVRAVRPWRPRARSNAPSAQPATYQRRIDLREVRSVTLSDKGDEFIVHVPSDYDYRFSSPRRAAALRALSIAYRTAARRELEGRVVALDTMASLVLERRQAQQKAAVRVSIVNGGTAPAAAAPADAAEQPHGALGWRGAALRKLRGLVSKKKKRYTENGADLDLSYITSRVIAMGFPADDFERFYRNPYTEVFALLEQKHGQHYFVYNLCSERRYSAAKFGGRVKEVPFDDHTPPRLSQMVEFCEHASRHLAADARNVIAVHCKAGKGRTGVMISCLLLYSGAAESAEGAMHVSSRSQRCVTRCVGWGGGGGHTDLFARRADVWANANERRQRRDHSQPEALREVL